MGPQIRGTGMFLGPGMMKLCASKGKGRRAKKTGAACRMHCSVEQRYEMTKTLALSHIQRCSLDYREHFYVPGTVQPNHETVRMQRL